MVGSGEILGNLPGRHVWVSRFLEQAAAGEDRCDRAGTSAEEEASVTPGFPERCPVPVRSAVLPLCDGFAVVAADPITELHADRPLPADVCVVPRMNEMAAAIPAAIHDGVWGIPLIPPRPGRPRCSGWVAKRAFDFIIGAALLMVCTPPLLAVVVWLCGGRPVLFRQIRVTRAGGLMQITKFRTITAQKPDADRTVSPDQGTRLGRLLRSTHLDDLPQFPDVIQGQMSLVGPAP